MKRLLGITGLTCLCVLTACFYLNSVVMYISAACAFVLFIVSLCIRAVREEGTLPVAFITVVISVAIFGTFTDLRVTPVQDFYDGKECCVVAEQTREMYTNNRFYCYNLKVRSIDGNKVKTNLLLFSEEHIYSDAYDELTFNTVVYANDYGGDLSKGIFLRAYHYKGEEDINVSSPVSKPLMYYIVKFRENLRGILYTEMSPDTAAFSSALLLGDKHSLSDEIVELLRLCGLSHISVVSGLHLSIIAFLAKKLFGLIPNRYVSSVMTILTIIFFVLLCGCTIPVIRSGIMLIVYIIGTMLPRQSDSLNSIGLAALFVLLLNPYSVGDIGMLLSFSATIGIVVWYNKLYSFIIRPINKSMIVGFRFTGFIIKTLVGILVCNICATVWTLPVSILAFGGFSAVGLVANLLIVPFVPVVIGCIILCLLTHFVAFAPIICQFFCYVIGLFYGYIIKLCTFLSGIPYAFIHTDKPYFYYCLAATCVLIAIAVLINTKAARKIVIAASVMMLVWGSVAYNISREDVVRIHIADTGSDLSVVMESTDGHAVLCLGGSKRRHYVVSDTISDFETENKNILITTDSENCIIYAENIASEFDYEQVLLYDNIDKSDLSEHKIRADQVSYYNYDETVNLWDKAQVELIPADDVVYEYVFAGDTEVLIIPEKADCSVLREEYRNPDVIILDSYAENIGLLTCETLIIPGDDFNAAATAEICAPVAEYILTGKALFYDIKVD